MNNGKISKKENQDFTVWTLKPGHLEEDRPITTFSEDKKILNFFCKRIYKLQGSTMQTLKTLKQFEPTWPIRKQPAVIGRASSKCSGAGEIA